MAHTGRAFGPWIVTSVDDWKTFAKEETRTYTGVLLDSKWKCYGIKIKSCLGLDLGLPLETNTFAFQ